MLPTWASWRKGFTSLKAILVLCNLLLFVQAEQVIQAHDFISQLTSTGAKVGNTSLCAIQAVPPDTASKAEDERAAPPRLSSTCTAPCWQRCWPPLRSLWGTWPKPVTCRPEVSHLMQTVFALGPEKLGISSHFILQEIAVPTYTNFLDWSNYYILASIALPSSKLTTLEITQYAILCFLLREWKIPISLALLQKFMWAIFIFLFLELSVAVLLWCLSYRSGEFPYWSLCRTLCSVLQKLWVPRCLGQWWSDVLELSLFS